MDITVAPVLRIILENCDHLMIELILILHHHESDSTGLH